MEPLGTITMYYQFLDKEIIDILNDTMQQADDYVDFCKRLVDKVCAEEVPTDLAYIAGVHASKVGNLKTIEGLGSKYSDIAHIRVWMPEDIHSRFPSKESAVEEALSENIDSWKIAELYHVLTCPPEIIPILQVTKYLSEGKELIQSNPNLECFLPYFLHTQAMMKKQEGNQADGIVDLETGLRIAKKYDDRYNITNLLLTLGNLMRDIRTNESWAYFEEAHKTAESIGYSIGTVIAMLEMSKVAAVRGEYDLAIHCLLKSEEECKIGRPIYLQNALNTMFMDIALSFARTFISMGSGVEALNWAEITIQRDGGTIYSIIEKARALILLGRLREAATQIGIANDLSRKDGREWAIGIYNFVCGSYELALGNTFEGMSALEEALGVFDQVQLDIFSIPCLIALSRTEVNVYDIRGDHDTSGPWMSKLEQRARERDYPGILMEHALLKAEFQIKQGAPEAARKTLIQALNIYDSPSVKTLRNRILGRIQEVPAI